MCTCARPYRRAGRCGFGGQGVTNTNPEFKMMCRGWDSSFNWMCPRKIVKLWGVENKYRSRDS
jgi:hypothetical protein